MGNPDDQSNLDIGSDHDDDVDNADIGAAALIGWLGSLMADVNNRSRSIRSRFPDVRSVGPV